MVQRIVTNASDNIIKILIIIVCLAFIKGLVFLIRLIDLETNIIQNKNSFKNIQEFIDTILDTILFALSVFVLFFRKDNSGIIIFLSILFFLKGFFQYFIDLKMYRYTNVPNDYIITLNKIKSVNSYVTNIFLLLASVYMLGKIFIN